MLETLMLSGIAFVLLGGASHRFRRDAGVDGAGTARMLRAVAAVVLAVALARAGTAMTGERWVRALAGASIAGVLVVLALSAAPARVLWPVRLALGRRGPAAASPRREIGGGRVAGA